MTCSFCPSPAIADCSWLVVRFVPSLYGEVRPGDLVRRLHQQAPHRPPARVHEVIDNGDSRTIDLRINGRQKLITVKAFSAVRIGMMVPCLEPVCDLHLREIGPFRFYCSRHWNSWEAVP